MQLCYDDDFVEAVVFRCASGRGKCVPSLQIARFHRGRERLYSLVDPDERNNAFFRFHLDWFREWEREKLLLDVFQEFPLLSEKLGLLAIRMTRNKHDDGAELYVNDAGQRSGVLVLPPDLMTRDDALRNYVRHEFMHLHDMLDPKFGYSPALDLPRLTAAQLRVAGERYRLLWDITIDGRLAAAGHSPRAACEQQQAAFIRGYAFWPAERQESVFASLWQGSSPRHRSLLELVADPRGFRDVLQPTPGGTCPLCTFPTFDWRRGEDLRPELAAAIVKEFPLWSMEDALCGRCQEAYEALAMQRKVVQA